MFACSLMPRPTETMRSACDRSTACLASWNGASGFCRIAAASTVDVERAHRRGRRALRAAWSARIRADLERDEMRRRALRHDVGGELALEHRPRRTPCRAVAVLIAGDVGDERAIEARRQLRREVARLVGVRQQHDATATAAPIAACSAAVKPSGVYGSSAACSTRDDFLRPARRRARRRRLRRRRPARATAIGAPDRLRQLLRAGDRFPRRAIQLAVALLGNDENHAQIDPRFVAQLPHQLLRGFGRRPVDHLRLLRSSRARRG